MSSNEDADKVISQMIARRAGTLSEADAAALRLPVERMARVRAFGRDLSEADVDATLSESGRPTIEDFQAVGLCETDAVSAARGLLEGTYISFEDACLSKSIFSGSTRTRLNQELMREAAAKFTTGTEVTS